MAPNGLIPPTLRELQIPSLFDGVGEGTGLPDQCKRYIHENIPPCSPESPCKVEIAFLGREWL